MKLSPECELKREVDKGLNFSIWAESVTAERKEQLPSKKVLPTVAWMANLKAPVLYAGVEQQKMERDGGSPVLTGRVTSDRQVSGEV